MIQAQFHDALFPYSELSNVHFESSARESVAGNGVTKIYIATPTSELQYPNFGYADYEIVSDQKQTEQSKS